MANQGRYALAAAKAMPHAVQVADRWHLMENASQAFRDAVGKSMRQIRVVLGAATLDPTLLTAAERIQYEGYLRREDDPDRFSRHSKISGGGGEADIHHAHAPNLKRDFEANRAQKSKP